MNVVNAATMPGTVIGTAGDTQGQEVEVGPHVAVDPTPALGPAPAAGPGTARTPETEAGPGTGPGPAPAPGIAAGAALGRGQGHRQETETVRGNALAAQRTEVTGVGPGPPWRMVALRRMKTPMSDLCNILKAFTSYHINFVLSISV